MYSLMETLRQCKIIPGAHPPHAGMGRALPRPLGEGLTAALTSRR